ncbi:MAG: MlaD family protein [Novosphingopyxis baekryungensis]|jgi:phospholipid/cholesterol/gamma-HCH transport system substrate-binding protein|nr:MlaD family protein [Novosphingopyxis baekryungensis]
METKSNNVLVGAVTLLLVTAAVILIIWLARFGEGDRKEYDIFFKSSVSGLATGSGVAYSGVPVGQVKAIKLWENDPEFVRVRISVDDAVPILQGTMATISSIGFTGVSEIQLSGAAKGAPPIVEEGPEGVPVIPTKPGALGELLNNAPLLVERLSTLTERLSQLLSEDNQESFSQLLNNVESISASFAQQAPELNAALKDARVAIAQAGDAAEQLGNLANSTDKLVNSDGQQIAAELRKTMASAQRSMEALEDTVTAAKPGVTTFSEQTLPEVNTLVRDLRATTKSLKNLTEQVEQGGAGSLISSQPLPDYEPK